MSKSKLMKIVYVFSFVLLLSACLLAEDVDKVGKAIKDLKSKDATVRTKAARSLGELKDKRAVKPLIKALRDKDTHVQVNAAWALGKIGDKRAVLALLKTGLCA